MADYKENGYTLFEGVFSRAQMDVWIARHDDLVQRQTPQGAERPTQWLNSVVEFEPWLMLPAVNNPHILDFAERVMGPFVQPDNHSGPNLGKIIQLARQKNDRRLLRLFGVDEQVFMRANSGYQVADEEMGDRWIREDRVARKS